MIDIRAEIEGDIKAILAGEAKAAGRAVALAVEEAGQGLKAELAAHTSGADLGRLGRAWTSRFYRNRGIDAAALIFPKGRRARAAIAAFEHGAIVRPKSGGRFLAIPTGFNRKGGRRGSAPLVSAKQMAASGRGMTFALETGRPGVKLWCIRTLRAQRRAGSARRIRDVATAGGFHVVARGRVRQTEAILRKGFIPMFVLVPQVSLKKRLDVKGIVAPWGARLAEAITRRWTEQTHGDQARDRA